MSADLERTELCEASMAYPSSPSEQQVRLDVLFFLAIFSREWSRSLCVNKVFWKQQYYARAADLTI